MRASYTAPVAATLVRQGIFFDHVSGVSAGASNTANYLSRDLVRTDHSFVEFAADPQFGDWRSFARGQGLFNAEYIYQRSGAEDSPTPFDFATFAANPARFAIAALDADTGRSVSWGRGDVHSLADLMIRVRASSTMPGLMPTVELDGHRYVDGALGAHGGIPLDLARDAGLERFAVVMTRPRDYVKKPAPLPQGYRALFGRQPAVVDALVNRWRGYNRTREELLDLEASGRAWLFFPDSAVVNNRERNLRRLRLSRELGYLQILRDLPGLRDLLGLSYR